MKTNKITISGIGSVIVDTEKGTLRPSSHVVGQRLYIGYSPDDTRKKEIADSRKSQILEEALDRFGQPEYGWEWLDHNGYRTDAF